MAFITYKNKSSVKKQNSRYIQGGVSSVGERFIRWWEKDVMATNDITDYFYEVIAVYAGKPDLIAYDFYDRNDLGWLVLQYNKIIDVNEELVPGRVIRLPERNRVFFEILGRPVAS